MLKKIIIGMLVISLSLHFQQRFYSWDTNRDAFSSRVWGPSHENLLFTGYLDAGDYAGASTGWEVDSHKGKEHLGLALLMTGWGVFYLVQAILFTLAIGKQAEAVVCYVLSAFYFSLAVPLWFVLSNLTWMEQYQAYSDGTNELHSGTGGNYHLFHIEDGGHGTGSYSGIKVSYVSIYSQAPGHFNPISHAGKREQTLDLCLLRGDEIRNRYHHRRISGESADAVTAIGFAFHCMTDAFAHGKLFNRMVYEMRKGFFQSQEIDISTQELYRRYLSGSASENQLYREFMHTDDDMVWGDGGATFGESPDDITKNSQGYPPDPEKDFKKQIYEIAYRMAYLSSRDWFVAIFKDEPRWYGLPECAVWWD